MKAVMYHYVRLPNSEYPYFKGLHIDDFKRQLDWFSNNGGFVNRDDFLKIFNGHEDMECPTGFILTFDDGLIDHYDFVYPELMKRGLFGVFYIPTLYLSSKKILDVHRIHLLVGRYGGKKMMEELQKIVTKDMLVKDCNSDFHMKTYNFPYNSNKYEVEFKRMLNYLISYEYLEYVLDRLFDLLIKDSIRCKDVYMSANQISELHNSGMIIGSHSESHKLMSRISIKQQNNEIKNSFNTLDSIVGGLKIKTFCYPYGGALSYNNDTINKLNHNKVMFSFDVNSKDISCKKMNTRRHMLPRYDTVDFPYGMSGL